MRELDPVVAARGEKHPAPGYAVRLGVRAGLGLTGLGPTGLGPTGLGPTGLGPAGLG